jgi:hypothetical protein
MPLVHGIGRMNQSVAGRIHEGASGEKLYVLRERTGLERIGSGSQGELKGLVAVKLTEGDALSRRRAEEGRCGLEVIFAGPWLKSLPIRSGLPVLCVCMAGHHRLPLWQPAP